MRSLLFIISTDNGLFRSTHRTVYLRGLKFSQTSMYTHVTLNKPDASGLITWLYFKLFSGNYDADFPVKTNGCFWSVRTCSFMMSLPAISPPAIKSHQPSWTQNSRPPKRHLTNQKETMTSELREKSMLWQDCTSSQHCQLCLAWLTSDYRCVCLLRLEWLLIVSIKSY